MDFWDYDTRLGAYAVVVDERDRILLARWTGAGEPRWSLPGGGVELDETTTEAAVRELREETGYDVALEAVLGVETELVPPPERLRDTDRWLKFVQVVYAARVVGGSLAFEVDGTTDAAAWVPVADVPGLNRGSLVDTALAAWQAHH